MRPVKIQEECGVFGISLSGRPSRDAAHCVYTALLALQHRGQESCGIAVSAGEKLLMHKADGLVPEVFIKKNLAPLEGGSSAIGHVRYSGESSGGSLDAQPILVRHASGSMALAYNGNLINSKQLRTETELRGGIFQSTTDAEVIAYLIVREHLRTNTTEDAILNAMQYMIGAYSIVVLSGKRLIAVRDPNGFRPLCMGELDGNIVFSSESCAIEALGGLLIRDVRPGEIISAENGRIRSFDCGIKARRALCVFEYIYFARPDSVIDGVPVDALRMEAGRELARHSDVKADIVIGVPDSGLASAMGFSRESGIPYDIGLIKNRYIGRSFIQPGEGGRDKAVRVKLNALTASVKGKRVILVDDSIVRGVTCAHIISILRDAGAREVHMKISSPPFLNQCYFGTYLPPGSALIASGRDNGEICRMIGADSLQYLTPEELSDITARFGCRHCDACFTGDYALPVSEAQ